MIVVMPWRERSLNMATKSVEKGAEMICTAYLERSRSMQLSATCHSIADLSLVVLCNIMRRTAARRSCGGRMSCETWEFLQMNARVAAGGAMCCVVVQHVAGAAFAGHCVLQKM